MTQEFDRPEDSSFDALLRGVLQARPEAAAPSNLAALAMERVAAGEAREAHLRQLGKWMRVTSMAAGLLLVLTLAVAVYVFPGSGESASSQDSGVASSSLDLTSMALVVLAAAVVGVSAKLVLTAERPALRIALA